MVSSSVSSTKQPSRVSSLMFLGPVYVGSDSGVMRFFTGFGVMKLGLGEKADVAEGVSTLKSIFEIMKIVKQLCLWSLNYPIFV